MAYCFTSCLILHLKHCIMLTLAHIQTFYALDQVHVEPESDVQADQAQAEGLTDLVWIKPSPSVFTIDPRLLLLNLLLCSSWLCIKFVGVV
jgi:hypothetical protein